MDRTIKSFSLNYKEDQDIIDYLKDKNISDYVKRLIREDMKRNDEFLNEGQKLEIIQLINKVISNTNGSLQVNNKSIMVDDATVNEIAVDEFTDVDPDVFSAINQFD